MTKFAFLFFFSSLLFLHQLPSAQAQIYIKMGEANIRKSLLAMPPFLYLGNPKISKDHLKVGKEIYDTVNNDLDVSSYFHYVRPSSYLENPSETGLKPKSQEENGFSFKSWQTLGATFLIRAGYTVIDNQASLEAYVYHVPTAKLIFGRKYETEKRDIRKMAHRFSNDVLEKLTGKRGMFESRVVLASAKAGSRNKEIYTMDWDGKGLRAVSKHKSIAISPAWSPDNQHIAYTAYAYHKKEKTRNADLFLLNLASGKRTALSTRKGINSGAAFIPGSLDLLATLSRGGSPDIYRLNRQGKVLERLTSGPGGAMNVEPAVSPDGKKVAFSSDRSGRPMIYVMDLKKPSNGKRKVKRIVFAGWYNASPSWSPDSKRIAFAGYDATSKHFDIFSMNNDGTGLIRLTTARKVNGKYSNNEDPTFSPDGRHVMFISDRTGTKQVYIVNNDGSSERRITFDRNDYYKPKWTYPTD